MTFQESRKVKIERKYRFAGKEVVLVLCVFMGLNVFMCFTFREVVEVPEDSPEAKKWPLWKDPFTESPTGAPNEVSLPPLPAPSIPVAAPSNPTSAPPNPTSAPPNPTPPPLDPTSAPVQMPNPAIPLQSTSTSASTKPPLRKPGPRKPKTSLAPLPGPSKAKKLSTLDKSAMDWQTHIHTEQHPGLKDELEANRKAGGYLEKVQFLKRVEERKDETIEALKSTKRRKL